MSNPSDTTELRGADHPCNRSLEAAEADGAAGSGTVATQDLKLYLCDMILELQQLASRAGYHEIAFRLLAAYETAERAGEDRPGVSEPLSRTG